MKFSRLKLLRLKNDFCGALGTMNRLLRPCQRLYPVTICSSASEGTSRIGSTGRAASLRVP